MANPQFPVSLPGPVVDSLKWTAPDNLIRSQMDAGVPKLRRRYTAVPEQLTCQMVVSRAGLQTLLDFHDITCAGGAAIFDWRDWRKTGTDPLSVCRWRSRPTYQAIDESWFNVTLDIDYLTTFQGTHLLDVAPLTT